MDYIPGGYQLFARKLLESDIWTLKPAWWWKVWTFFILSVNYEGGLKMPRGSEHFTYEQIIRGAHLHQDQITSLGNVIRWLKQTRQITTQKTRLGLLIHIVNYERFQNPDNYKTRPKTTEKTKPKTTEEIGMVSETVT